MSEPNANEILKDLYKTRPCENCIHISICRYKDDFETAMVRIADSVQDAPAYLKLDVKCDMFKDDFNPQTFFGRRHDFE